MFVVSHWTTLLLFAKVQQLVTRLKAMKTAMNPVTFSTRPLAPKDKPASLLFQVAKTLLLHFQMYHSIRRYFHRLVYFGDESHGDSYDTLVYRL